VIWYPRRFLQGVDDHVFHSEHRFVMTFVSTSVKFVVMRGEGRARHHKGRVVAMMPLREQVRMNSHPIVATRMLLCA
jgi:hypothetical protein